MEETKAIDTEKPCNNFCCAKCNQIFSSRNKLFKHINNCSVECMVHPPDFDAYDYYIYVMGGRHRGKTLGSVERYCINTNMWEKSSAMTDNRGSHGAGSFEDKLFVFGGGGFKSNLSSCEYLCNNEWKLIAPMNIERHALSVASIGDVFYALGGWIDGKECSAVLESYNSKINTWSILNKMNHARKLHGVTSYDNKIYVFGGCCDPPEWYTDTAECYDPITDTWMYLPSLPHSGGASAVSVAPYIYIFQHGKYVYRYNPITQIYMQVSTLPLPDWHCFDTVTLGRHVYIIGGATNGEWSNAAFRYDVVENSFERLSDMNQPRRRCAAALVYFAKGLGSEPCHQEV